MKNMFCIQCGESREIGRRICRNCNLQRLIDLAKITPRYMFEKICIACKCEFQAWRKNQEVCKECYREMQRIKQLNRASNTYIVANGNTKNGKKFRHVHRKLAEDLLLRTLHTNEVVHHLDENSQNNSLYNLVVLDRKVHSKLHAYLDLQRVILEKSGIENSENCWKTLIIPMTTTWLEMAGVKVIKLWEIGQSAAEPLMEKSDEEGSETMHGTSVTDNAVEDDIVQTTTV